MASTKNAASQNFSNSDLLDDMRLHRFLTILVLLLMITLTIILVYATRYFPVQVVTITGQFGNIDVERVQTMTDQRVSGNNFFQLNLPALKTEIEQLPWVKSVRLRRIWPNQLDISLEPEEGVARWNDNEIINSHGEVFIPNHKINAATQLIRFSGDDEQQRLILLYDYQVLAPDLNKLDLQISAMKLFSSGILEIKTEKRVKLVVLQQELLPMIRRFIKVYPWLLEQKGGKVFPSNIDLRYPQGMAVKWGEA